METGLTSGTPTDEYNYHSPFMRCSSYEEVFKKIPDVLSTEEWVTMIMHEYFHGFQFKHPTYMDYYEKNIIDYRQGFIKFLASCRCAPVESILFWWQENNALTAADKLHTSNAAKKLSTVSLH